MDKQHIGELKRMIKEKKATEAVEKVLTKFCARHGVSLDACRIYYRRLVENGEIKENSSFWSLVTIKNEKGYVGHGNHT